MTLFLGLFGAFLLTFVFPSVSLAQDSSVSEVLDLSPDALSQFVRLQDGWLEWLAASHQGDRSRATAALDRLLSDTRNLGMERLPDLSLGAAAQAIWFARDERWDVASWCLTAAETLDPDRPEVAFASANVAVLKGEYWRSVRFTVLGLQRLVTERLSGYLWRADLGHWILFSVLVAGALFVAALMFTSGVDLFGDVYSFVGRFVPVVVAMALTLVLMLWPLVLPAGLLWLALYWSILLWSYSSTSERVLLIGLWIVLCFSPGLINEQRQRVRVALAPTTMSLDAMADGRLRGSLFGDLATLREALPQSVAVTQVIADLHSSLKEWASAQVLYTHIISEEPENGAALVNLGVSYFHQDDFPRAMKYFQKAVETEQAAALARFNMSQTLSEVYRFREAERELGIAQKLASPDVKRWLRRSATERAVYMKGGLQRADEIRGELVASWRSDEGDARWSGFWPSVVSLPLALAFVVIAVALHFIVRKHSGKSSAPARSIAPAGSYRAVFLPGLAEVEDDHPMAGYFALLVFVALASLPMAAELGYRLPWIFSTSQQLLKIIVGLSLATYFLFRFLGQKRKGL